MALKANGENTNYQGRGLDQYQRPMQNHFVIVEKPSF